MNDPSIVESVFLAALEQATDEARSAYLDDACKDNPGLREQVNCLLAAHPKAVKFMGQPATPAGEKTAAYIPTAEQVETIVAGRYKLLEMIGEGGMGEVWVADQLEPIRRRVALKLIKPGMDSRSVLARFEAERQALALMDHPNIAKVLDAGTTADQRPYFVMELVKGTPITEFCDARKLSARERLELFVPVCQAIQHAHTKGIIHRDIKPSNVLVALHDERPVPKVIDFGVAKAVGQQLTEKTIYTGFGGLVGTPAYMAPEQATFNQLDIDTRADVYALGVLLYELLAGSPPVEPERMRKAALDEVLRLVREEEPPRPSQRLSTSQSKASIAAIRQTDPAKLTKLIQGELDWIVMKALEKDRNRRYETATAFAADVMRYLVGEQVHAVPPSAVYRLRKFSRRNRRALLTTAVVCLAVFGGGVMSAWQVAERKREQAERRWEQERVTARAREAVQLQLDRAEAGLKFHQLGDVTGALGQAELLLADTDAPDLRDRLARAKKDLDTVRCLDDIFAWRWNLAKGQVRLFPNKAKELYPPAFRQYGLAIGEEPAETTVQAIRRSTIANALRMALEQWFFLEPTQPGLQSILNAEDPDPFRVEIRAAVATGQHERVRQLFEESDQTKSSPDFAIALGMYLPVEPSLRLMKAVWSRRPDSFPLTIAVAARLTELDVIQGNAMEAVGWCRIAIAIRPDSAFAHHCLGVALGEVGDTDGRIAELREAMRLAPRFQRAAALLILDLLGPIHGRDERKTAEATELCKSLVAVNPKHVVAHAALYRIYTRQKKWGEAACEYQQFHDLVHSMSKDDWQSTSCPEQATLTGYYDLDSDVLVGLVEEGHPADAFRLCELSISEQQIEDLSTSWVYVNRPHETVYQGARAAILWIAGQGKDASPLAEQAGISRKARQWLLAALTGWTNCFNADPAKNRAWVHEQMTHWLADANLASIRDEHALVKLPADERAGWQKLWADVRSLRDRTAPSKAAPANPKVGSR